MAIIISYDLAGGVDNTKESVRQRMLELGYTTTVIIKRRTLNLPESTLFNLMRFDATQSIVELRDVVNEINRTLPENEKVQFDKCIACLPSDYNAWPL